MLYLGTCRCQPEWPSAALTYGRVPGAISSVVVVPPAEEPLTLAEVKLNHRIDGDDEDTELERQIQAAREYVERYLGQSLVTQTREATYAYYDATWPASVLPYGPVQSVESVTQDSTTGLYVVQYIAGYPSAGEGDLTALIPASIKQAMQLIIGDWYEHREDIIVGTTAARLTTGLRQLLDFYRKRGGFA
jgi:Phage gp6-like head-tail connector protein